MTNEINTVSSEPRESRALYLLNSELLYSKTLLKQRSGKMLGRRNLQILLSYIRSMSFKRIHGRITKEMHRRHLQQQDELYPLRVYDTYPNIKVAVYTCITAGYDTLLEPYYVNPNIDYYVITDMVTPADSAWKSINIETALDREVGDLRPNELNRYFKMLPHRVFKDYDVTIYVDGNVRIVTDMMPLVCDLGKGCMAIHDFNTDCVYEMKDIVIASRKATRRSVEDQIRVYRSEGFPKHFGAFECNILLRRHMDPVCMAVMEEWWKEYITTGSRRDQLSLPYAIWKSGKDAALVKSMGPNVRLNPRFQIGINHG